MSYGSRNLLGIAKSTGYTASDILSKYRSKLRNNPENLSDINAAVLELMKSLGKPLVGEKLCDKIFDNLIEGSTLSSKKITLFLRGFKSLSHKGMFDIFKNKYGKQIGSQFQRNECEVIVDPVTLPNDRSGLPCNYPVLKIKISSSISYLKFELFGDSGCIFVFFYLKKIIETFLKKLPEKIENCYSPPKKTNKKLMETDLTDESEDSSPIIPRSSKIGQKIILSESDGPESHDEIEDVNEKITISDSDSIESVDKKQDVNEKITMSDCDSTGTLPSIENNKKEDVNAEKQVIEDDMTPQRESQKKSKEGIEDNILACSDCALFRLSDKVNKLVETSIEIITDCSLMCLNDTTNNLDFFVDKLVEMMSKPELVEVNSMPQLNRNIEKILSELQIPLSTLYCKILHRFDDRPPTDRDRLIVCLREILGFGFTDQFSFYEDKRARRIFFDYMETTGSYFCFQKALESLFDMFRCGVDLVRILPEKLKYLIELFEDAPTDLDMITYHDYMGEICRGIISDVFGRKNINFVKLTKKIFKGNGDSVEIISDSFLYIERLNDRICHFLNLGEEMYLEPIKKSSLKAGDDDHVISTDIWEFHLEREADIEVKKKKDRLEEEEVIEVEKKKDHFEEQESNEDDKKDVQSEDNIELHDQDKSKDEEFSDDIDEEVADNDREKLIQTVSTKIKINKDDVLEYFDKTKRKFVPGSCGAVWPRMYNSPCCVVCGYNYIQLVGTQQRFGHFGTLKGKCKICKGLHVFKVKESPFTEKLVNNVVQYTAVKDMEVEVTVTGEFHVDQNGHPDITNPVHDVQNSKGLHLKGKERQKMAKRAAEIGVKEAYMEQLGNADMEQVKAGNRSSIRSIPVIKMARKEKEQKEAGGLNFYQSVMNVFETQQDDVSPNFEATTNNKKLPGIIRKVLKMKDQCSNQVLFS